ncbi:MAG TPA: alpha/beta hydrolase [Myxococcota bacterium]|nr:alpha/beta hydrolase [Myxococcota bacterium]
MAQEPAQMPADMLQRMMAMMSTPPSDVPGLRKMLDQFAELLNAGGPEIGALHENVLVREVDGARVTADVFVPKGKGPHPVLVYLHGGGWVAGSPRTHRKLTARFAEAGYLVTSIDYRLAPEAAFPKGFEDCVHAVRWAAENAARWGGDARRIAIGGDSAGGNLSAAVSAHLASDSSAPRLRAALLIYGAFDFEAMRTMETAQPGTDPAVAAALRDSMIYGYLGQNPPLSRLRDPRVSPVHAAAQLPPSYLVCGDADPLVEHQKALSAGMKRAGVEHENVIVPGMPHGFAQMEFLPQALEQVRGMVAFLDKRLR